MSVWIPITVDHALRLLSSGRAIEGLYAHENGAWWTEDAVVALGDSTESTPTAARSDARRCVLQ